MLTETRELRERRSVIVMAHFEPHGRKDTMALIEGLEMIPARPSRAAPSSLI
jgi:K+-sensing histidine kinase KdpD